MSIWPRFIEGRPTIEEDLESEDPGMRVLARYFLAKKKHREMMLEGPPRGASYEKHEGWFEDYRNLGHEVYNFFKEVFITLDTLDDWIYSVPNSIIGTFYVRTVDEAVEGLARFALTPSGRNFIKSEKSREKWKKQNRVRIQEGLEPIKLGPYGFIMKMRTT